MDNSQMMFDIVPVHKSLMMFAKASQIIHSTTNPSSLKPYCKGIIHWLVHTICSFRASTSSCSSGPLSEMRRCWTRTRYMAKAERACTLLRVPPFTSRSTTSYLGSGGWTGAAGGGKGWGASTFTSWTATCTGSFVVTLAKVVWLGVEADWDGVALVWLVFLASPSSRFPLPSPCYTDRITTCHCSIAYCDWNTSTVHIQT